MSILKYSSLILVLGLNVSLAASDEERNGYYFPSIKPEKVALVETALEKEVPESLGDLFNKEYLPYVSFLPLEKQPKFDSLRKFLILQSFYEVRDQKIDSVKKESLPGWEKERGLLLSRHENHKSFEGSFEAYEVYLLDEAEKRGLELKQPKLREKLEIFFKRYQSTIETLGFQNNTWLRHFVNAHLLFPVPQKDRGFEQRNRLWKILKDSGLIETQIPDNLEEWTYDSSVAIRQAVDKLKPKVLTLGCGTTTLFNHDDIDVKINDSFGRFDGLVWNCVSCGDLHKDELSVAYQEPIKSEWDMGPSTGYDATSHATVRGDMVDPKLWAALEGPMFETIK
ncbi:MAG: hypothetical protein ACK5PQ_03975 [Alphaproteobacteria bacterium]